MYTGSSYMMNVLKNIIKTNKNIMCYSSYKYGIVFMVIFIHGTNRPHKLLDDM